MIKIDKYIHILTSNIMVEKVIKCIILIRIIQNSQQFNFLHFFQPPSLKKKIKLNYGYSTNAQTLFLKLNEIKT